MKTFTTSLAAIIFALSILTSCGPAAQDIDITELKEPCDFADAMLTVANEIIELTGGDKNKRPHDLDEEDEEKMRALWKKGDVIRKWAKFLEIDYDDINECPSMKKLDKLQEEGKVDM